MKTTYIEVPRRRRPRRYKKCGCQRGRSPLIDTAHTPLARWGFTLLALAAATNQLTWPALVSTALAFWSWRHR